MFELPFMKSIDNVCNALNINYSLMRIRFFYDNFKWDPNITLEIKFEKYHFFINKHFINYLNNIKYE